MPDALRDFLNSWARARSWLPELVLLACALGLGAAALGGEPLPLEIPIGEAVHAWQLPLLDPVLHGVSAIGWFRFAAPTTVAVVVVLALAGWRAYAVVLGAAALTSHLLNQLLKGLIARPRPPMAPEELAALGVDSFAFPSGHVQSYTIFYGFLAYAVWQEATRPWLRRLGAAAMLAMVVLVGISRIYLGVHWASDVLGGYCIGVLWLLLWTRALRAWQQRP